MKLRSQVFLVYSVIFVSVILAEIFPQTSKTCDQGQTCESKHTCEWVRDKYQQMSTASNDGIKESVVKQLKAAVCNKAKKAFCCPQDSSGGSIPSTAKTCGPGETCQSKDTCEWAKHKYQQIRGAATSPQTSKSITKQLKASVCNKEKKAFCCPRDDGAHISVKFAGNQIQANALSTRVCDVGETCEPKETCEWVKEKYQQVRTATNDHIKKSIVHQLKTAVCNKEKKSFCCPYNETEKISLKGAFNTNESMGTAAATRICNEGETCEPKENCEWVKEKYQLIRTTPNGDTREALVNQLKAAVCNKAKKTFCCPDDDTEKISLKGAFNTNELVIPEAATRICNEGETCEPKETCEWVKEKYELIRTTPNGDTRQTIVNQFKTAVCNKAKKAFCCPPQQGEVGSDEDGNIKGGEDDENENIKGHQSLGVPSTTRICSQDKTCQTKETCEWARSKYQKIITTSDRDYKEFLINQMKEAVCNKEKKAFCCPHDEDSTKNTSEKITLRGADSTKATIVDTCSEGRTCGTKEACEWVRDKYEEVRTAANGATRNSLVNQLKAAVCDKKKKTFCCPRPRSHTGHSASTFSLDLRSDDTSGTFLPLLGECGGQGDAANIVGGEGTQPGEFPFMALIGYSGKCRRRPCFNCPSRMVPCITFQCGGTLINRRYVLTAAHCHVPANTMPVRQVVLGEWQVGLDPDCQFSDGKCVNELLPGVQKFKISNSDVTLHPRFRKGNRNNAVVNDIALIRLPHLAQLNQGTRPVCLPSGDSALKTLRIPNFSSGLLSTFPTVVGWGYTMFNPLGQHLQGGFNKGAGNVASTQQQKLTHGLLSNNECGRFQLEASQICGASSRGHGACKGDSGSGLYLNGSFYGPPWYQIGIVSFGDLACHAGEPVVYTRISSFMPWIKQNLKP